MSVGDDVLITGPTGAEMLLPEDQTGIGGPLRLDTLALALVVFKFLFCWCLLSLMEFTPKFPVPLVLEILTRHQVTGTTLKK